MIKANELRIGNYFYDRGGKVLQLHYWEAPGKLAMNNVLGGITLHPLTEYTEYANPIPLNEEWLLRFGFDQYAISYYRKKDFYIGYANTGLHQYKLRDYPVIVSTVHHLQNLFFELEREELTSLQQPLKE